MPNHLGSLFKPVFWPVKMRLPEVEIKNNMEVGNIDTPKYYEVIQNVIFNLFADKEAFNESY